VKRSAIAALEGAAKDRTPKSAKLAVPAAAAEVPSQALEPALEWCRPAFDLLDFLGDSLPPACVDMLRAAAPHALDAKVHERHAYQTAVIDSLARLCAEALKSHRAAVASAEAAVSTLLQDKERAAEQLAAATSDEEAKREAKGVAATTSKSAEEVVAATRQVMESARKKLEEVESLAQVVSEAKVDFEKEIEEIWVPLKSGTFPPKEWRARQKAIARASEILTQAEIPASLAAAVPIALKERLESRTDFGAQAIEHADIALREHIASIATQLEGHQATVESQTQAVAKAEGEVKAAEAELAATLNAQIEAENTWVDADSAVRDLKVAIGSFGETGEQLDSELMASRTSLEKLQSLVGRFEGLRASTEVQPMDAVAEVPKDVSAEVLAHKVEDMAAQPPADPPADVPADSVESEGHHAVSTESSAA